MTMLNIDAITKKIDHNIELPTIGSWPASVHQLDQKTAHAILAALMAQRPLLVKGEPGTGKSQLARAAAAMLQWPFISKVIQPNTEPQDLLWSYDYTQRLADAQLVGVTKDLSALKDNTNYLSPGPLWYALDWQDACDYKNQSNYRPATKQHADQTDNGVVLLLDEIDKADTSLANTLLETLGNNGFEVPLLGKTVRSPAQPPLVILTSNATRELPAALVRRCVTLTLTLPEDGLLDYFVQIGKAHHPDMQQEVLSAAAKQIVADREKCDQQPKTGLAEYLDLLNALAAISVEPAKQIAWLDTLQRYFYKSDQSVLGG